MPPIYGHVLLASSGGVESSLCSLLPTLGRAGHCTSFILDGCGNDLLQRPREARVITQGPYGLLVFKFSAGPGALSSCLPLGMTRSTYNPSQPPVASHPPRFLACLHEDGYSGGSYCYHVPIITRSGARCASSELSSARPKAARFRWGHMAPTTTRRPSTSPPFSFRRDSVHPPQPLYRPVR